MKIPFVYDIESERVEIWHCPKSLIEKVELHGYEYSVEGIKTYISYPFEKKGITYNIKAIEVLLFLNTEGVAFNPDYKMLFPPTYAMDELHRNFILRESYYRYSWDNKKYEVKFKIT